LLAFAIDFHYAASNHSIWLRSRGYQLWHWTPRV
jgi:hypothetical protein